MILAAIPCFAFQLLFGKGNDFHRRNLHPAHDGDIDKVSFEKRGNGIHFESDVCSTASNDDNLTSSGRSFVSLDAMPNGVALSDDQDSSTPGSWLNKNTIRPPVSSEGVSQLPTHIEDTIRKVMHDFNELDVFDQNMLLHQMTGATMTDFATMKWVPHEMKRAQSKEFVDYRWRRLLSRFPLAAAIKKASSTGSGMVM